MPIELHVFSDMQRTELAPTFSDMTLPSNISLTTHAVSTQAQPNWTVESVDAPGQVWGKDVKAIHVDAVIAGYGTPAAERKVSTLVVNGRADGDRKLLPVPANGRAIGRISIARRTFCRTNSASCEVKIARFRRRVSR